jgi:hypothetical protein
MRIRIALPVTLLLLFSYYATGQEITGTISGRVTDPSGAAVPRAIITVMSIDMSVTVRSSVHSLCSIRFISARW